MSGRLEREKKKEQEWKRINGEGGLGGRCGSSGGGVEGRECNVIDCSAKREVWRGEKEGGGRERKKREKGGGSRRVRACVCVCVQVCWVCAGGHHGVLGECHQKESRWGEKKSEKRVGEGGHQESVQKAEKREKGEVCG